jgi:hypothetical protein
MERKELTEVAANEEEGDCEETVLKFEYFTTKNGFNFSTAKRRKIDPRRKLDIERFTLPLVRSPIP